MTLRFAIYLCIASTFVSVGQAGDFAQDIRPLLMKYCGECHSGDDSNGDVDFASIQTNDEVNDAFELWESVAGHIRNGTMPPEDNLRPNETERETILQWYEHFVSDIPSRPAVLRPRRLSVVEYRNTLRSLLGFDLQVDVIEAEQTVSERSMVVKLLPTDPPGKSGFTNDTHNNPITPIVWDQMSYLVDAALEELFSPQRRAELQVYTGPIGSSGLSPEQAARLIREFVPRAYRRPADPRELDAIVARIAGLHDGELVSAVKLELKTVLMSPAFIYRGLLVTGQRGERQAVDSHEFAERLSYFLWADMPDDELTQLASNGRLMNPDVSVAQIDRMLASSKAKSLSEVFAVEWLTLNEIEKVSDNVPVRVALKTQPIEFMNYLFTEDRPLMELIESKTTFINPHTGRMYGRDAKQLPKYMKRKGVEVEIVRNHRVELRHASERGGILTMPGVLAMNRGPILRGTWILERILGEELPDPPANVGAVQPSPPGKKLTFRERFEQHRDNAACAVCHDKVDPLGFALQHFDAGGKYILADGPDTNKKKKKNRGEDADIDPRRIDSSGRLPSGESFEDASGLKKILVTTQREKVVRCIVKRTTSYALGRKLQVFDAPMIESIVQKMICEDGTWRDLFIQISQSVAFRETILSP
ncbi:MAG: DUF1592 domain-containing protein [Pirellulaceae bacterium]|nr:DUF1592 domain-containing protein [Pirellulaceae bacterium]